MPPLPILARVPGGVGVTVEELGGRDVVVVRTDAGIKAGALTAIDGDTVAAGADLARDAGIPLIGIISSSGADLNEGIIALNGWGVAAHAVARCSGIVPVAIVVTGPAVSGPALLLGLADIVVMTEAAVAYVSGPRMVADVTGVRITQSELGGATVHARQSGVAAAVVADEAAALAWLADTLAYLPSSNDDEPPAIDTGDPFDRADESLRTLIPSGATGAYDVRQVAAGIVDDGIVHELWARYSPNMVCAFATLGGRPVGIVANQPQSVAGTLDIAASQKGARFVSLCDAFNVPLLTLVDTPGFFPGKDQEWRGMIRHGAELAFAYARATVPRLCVILRKAYGGAYIVMDCKTMGNDLCLAWPSAEVAVMGASGAVQILYRNNTAEERAAAQAEYEEHVVNPWIACERGFVDAVVDPSETRAALIEALQVIAAKRELISGRKHDNTPV